MRRSPLLHHEPVRAAAAEDRAPDGWLGVLHGIYGHGRNWASVARRLVRTRPGWGVDLYDLREHGDSHGFEPPHTVESTARDVLRTARDEGPPLRALLGHSFGGKIALEYVRLAADDGLSLPEQVWVLDSTPATAEPRGGPWGLLEALRAHPGPFRGREEAVHGLEEEGYPPAISRWMAQNVEEGLDGAWRWRVDPDSMEALLADFYGRDLWAVVESPPPGVDIHVVRATDSDVIAGATLERLGDAASASGRVHLHEIEGHHWLNADDPQAIASLLADRLP
ncbi:MAG: alpha/beta hydrolase [Gemmatimonadota bacterium]|jgi:pimeloyl-ACP methyl ester carboxylesterase